MALAAGAQFEHYEIESVIGVGGMGEGYRARDTKRERLVALKVVRDSFDGDPDRLARFHRETKLLAGPTVLPLMIRTRSAGPTISTAAASIVGTPEPGSLRNS